MSLSSLIPNIRILSTIKPSLSIIIMTKKYRFMLTRRHYKRLKFNRLSIKIKMKYAPQLLKIFWGP